METTVYVDPVGTTRFNAHCDEALYSITFAEMGVVAFVHAPVTANVLRMDCWVRDDEGKILNRSVTV